MAALIAILAVFGGGNAGSAIPATDFVETGLELQTDARNFNTVTGDESYGSQPLIPEHDPDLAPAPYRLIEATPTPAAIAVPTVTAAASTPALSSPASGLENCPPLIVDTFGEHAPAACAVAWCESRFDPHAVGDGGRSLGWFQLWTGWAAWYGVQVDALFDPATNAAVARAVFEYRGRWGGAGGWTCADLLGIW